MDKSKLASRVNDILESAYRDGYDDGRKRAIEEIGNSNKGVAKPEPIADKQKEDWRNEDVVAWCGSCDKPLYPR